VCCDGGDVIRLVERVENLDFMRAVEWLGGERATDPAETARRETDRKSRQEKIDREAQYYREKERRTTFEMWRRTSPLAHA
jgi:DNA primase